MTPERWRQVKEIFQSALDRAPGQRSAFLSEACGLDKALRKEVESLIASHEKDGSFIDSPAYQVAAQELAEDHELKAGQTIGHYQVLSMLGRGGMGEVYLARDSKLGRNVALKFLPGAFTMDPERLRRFEQEARSASALNHPNIITIHEIGEVKDHRFIATEFIDGQTLRQSVAGGGLKISDILSIAEQVTSAMVAAHSAGIIHRDLKPENIMRRHDGIAKVLDFGLAKLTQQKEVGAEDATRKLAMTSAGAVIGTVSYMSPEQARGLVVDARTDIWSLGVVIYEMLSGQQPFGGATNSDVLAAILEREPKSLAGFSRDFPDELEWIVNKALTKDREDRYQTARELLNDLRRLKQRLSVALELERSLAPDHVTAPAIERATRPDPAVTASSKLIKNRFVWAILVVAMIALASFVIWRSRAYLLRPAAQSPVVVLMDSPLPDRVYDPETRKNGGTNADDISDILRDLPIVIEKENTSPLWHREDQVLRENPAVIVIHRSCFADSSMGMNPQSPAVAVADSKLETFLGYVGLSNPNTKFLIYTRRAGDQSAWESDLQKRFPQLSGRIVAIQVPGGPEHATFRDPETQKMVRQQVQLMLGLH